MSGIDGSSSHPRDTVEYRRMPQWQMGISTSSSNRGEGISLIGHGQDEGKRDLADTPKSLAVLEEASPSTSQNTWELSLPLATAIDHFIESHKDLIQYDTTNPDHSTFVRDRINPMNASMFDRDVFFQKYIDAQRDVRTAILATFQQLPYQVDSEQRNPEISNFHDFQEWLKDLHILSAEGRDKEAVYRTDVTPGKFHTKDVAKSNYNAEFLLLRPVAERLDDPFKFHDFRAYSDTGSELNLPGISQEARPKTIGSEHIYPSAEYHSEYLREMQRSLLECLALGPTDKPSHCIERIAQFYQHAANSHLFDQINNSMFMNITNTLLERVGMVGMPHGKLDYAAMVLQPKAFVRYFAAQVVEAQDTWSRTQGSPKTLESNTEPTKVVLPTGQVLELAHAIPDRLRTKLQAPTQVRIEKDPALISRRYDPERDCDIYLDRGENKTYIVFTRDLRESDIGEMIFLNKYALPHTAAFIQEQDGRLGILLYESLNDEATVSLTPEGAFESIMNVIRYQETAGSALGLLGDDGNVSARKLAGNSVYRSSDHRVDTLVPLSAPSLWDDHLKNYRAINKEKRAAVHYFLQRAGISIKTQQLRRENIISRGARGLIYKDEQNSSVIKTTKLLRGDDVYQMMIQNQYFQEKMPGFPRFLGFGQDELGNITTEYEFIPDLIPLNKFTGVLSQEEIDTAIQHLRNFHTVTGHVHGDLHEENIQIQTQIVDGKEKHVVWFLDPCGVGGESNSRSSPSIEISTATDLLNDTLVRNFKHAPASVPTEESSL